MPQDTKLCAFHGRMVIVGFGSIGPGALPLFLRHIAMGPDQVTIITADERGHAIATALGVRFIIDPLLPQNHRDILTPKLGRGDILVNLSVDVSSVALIAFCHEVGALYLDTCIEPWVGGYTDPAKSPSERSNYALRETALAIRKAARAAGDKGPTAVITHGANPGLVSHFVKQALLNIAKDTGLAADSPRDREGWARLAQTLGIKVIHIAERDTQVANRPKAAGEFVNTWSIDGFAGEGCQPAELGWGSHEKTLPPDGRRHDFGSDAAIYLARPGAATTVRTWTPNEGPFHGFLITHNESISIADFLTVHEGAEVRYRPTVHYAYHPCDDAVTSLHELAGKNWTLQARQRLMMDEIVTGTDELGVLLMGHARKAYWYGSVLSIDEARQLVPYNNATSLQVTASVLAGVVYAIRHPNEGIVEPEEIDFQFILDVCRPYLGRIVGVYGDWTPLDGRETLFPEDIDRTDPWQFKNFRVV